ncbi:MAG: type II toxin-antitoxin system VapC family toxin [Nitrososphaeria archaeon]
MKPEESEQPKQKPKYLVDANIILELELGQEKADICEKVLRKFCTGELEGVLVDFAIDTIVIIMENYGKTWDEIRLFLSSLIGYRGLRIHTSSLLDRIEATTHMKNHNLDFDDAMALQAMNENGIERIITYDKDFDSIPHIKRIQPEELL